MLPNAFFRALKPILTNCACAIKSAIDSLLCTLVSGCDDSSCCDGMLALDLALASSKYQCYSGFKLKVVTGSDIQNLLMQNRTFGCDDFVRMIGD